MAEAAVGKRIKISKIQQHIMLATLATSLVFGVSLVFSIFFVKFIIFNTTVIDEKAKSIQNYYTAIKNVGICIDENNDNKFSDKDLEKCDPESIEAEDIPGTLRNNVLIGMTNNNSLESVARDSQKTCYDDKGKKIDFNEQYKNASSDSERADKLYMLKMCSSLRVIPDALPATKNDEALLSSMNQIFLQSGLQPESLAPNQTGETSPIDSIEVIPVSVSIEDNVSNTTRLLRNLEKSIRAFSFRTAVITWMGETAGNQKLELSASALSFYTNEITASDTTKTLYASKKARSSNQSSGSNGVQTVDDVVQEKTGMDTK